MSTQILDERINQSTSIMPRFESETSNAVHWSDRWLTSPHSTSYLCRRSSLSQYLNIFMTWTASTLWRPSTAFEEIDNPLYREITVTTVDPTFEIDRKQQELKKKIDRCFDLARDEYFEDGKKSVFSTNLISIVRAHGSFSLGIIRELILGQHVDPYVASEALLCLGNMGTEQPTFAYRLWLVEQALTHSSPIIRDGALLALSSFNATHAIPYVQAALAKEKIEMVRKSIVQVLDQLEEARGCHSR